MKKLLLSALGASALAFAVSACGGDDSRNSPEGEPPITEAPGGENPGPGGEQPGPGAGGEQPGPGAGGEQPGGENPSPGGGGDPGPSVQTFELRMKGSKLSGFTTLRVPVTAVDVTVDGKPLEVRMVSTLVDLAANPEHAPLVARFEVPKNAGIEHVHVSVSFNEMGAFSKDGAAMETSLDAHVAPLSFDMAVRDLAVHGRAVLELDMEHSLVPRESSSLLLPTGSVKF
ncbi:hypothetical protein LZ198_10160 [Myxococcus sp. K15C18031901]|uniref:hypothetical protein n=1 Tax=Myxococcus dinghuensis TaxID=2906761 RepID=UPI0020A790D4|nr:hypothetical protein [Myxococcus dinghuensis]MCP3099233.1 hypothetical protein [Myxococcus dinghuensis]